MPRALLVFCCLVLLVSAVLAGDKNADDGAVAADTTATAYDDKMAAAIAEAEAAAAADLYDASADPGFEVLLEGGLVVPVGDLGAGFRHTATGLGVEQGYRLGMRVRWIRKGGLTIAPNFTLSLFGDHDDRDDITGKTAAFAGKFTLDASVLRYGLDIGYLAPGEPDDVRPYVGVGAGVMRNRYKETQVDEDVYYEDTVHSFAWLLTVGARWRELEVALEYHGTSLETARFFQTDGMVTYDWSHVAVRVGYALPRF